MRISDWSSDVCSSDLRFRDDPVHEESAVALDWLRKASSVTAGSSCTGSSRKRSESAIDRLLERIDADAAIGVEETLARLAVRLIDIGRLFDRIRSEEHTSELQSLMRISYAVFCLKKKQQNNKHTNSRT